MTSIFLGLMSAGVGLFLFAAGVYVGRKFFRRAEPVAPEMAGACLGEDDEDPEAVRSQRERLMEEQRAFHDLLGYNASVAYGVNSAPRSEE